MMPAAAPGRRVSPLLPLSYLVAATAAFVLAAFAVPWLAPALAGHYYQPRVLALTHAVTLGWIIWYRVYAARAGREPVPSLRELGWPAGERLAWMLLTTGLAALPVALAAGEVEWIRGAGVLVALGALAFAATLARVLHHLMPCARRPLVAAASRAGTA